MVMVIILLLFWEQLFSQPQSITQKRVDIDLLTAQEREHWFLQRLDLIFSIFFHEWKKTPKENLHKEFRREPGRGVKEGA